MFIILQYYHVTLGWNYLSDSEKTKVGLLIVNDVLYESRLLRSPTLQVT